MTRYRYVAVLWTLLILLGCWVPPSILARSGHSEIGGPIMGFIPRDKFVPRDLIEPILQRLRQAPEL